MCRHVVHARSGLVHELPVFNDGGTFRKNVSGNNLGYNRFKQLVQQLLAQLMQCPPQSTLSYKSSQAMHHSGRRYGDRGIGANRIWVKSAIFQLRVPFSNYAVLPKRNGPSDKNHVKGCTKTVYLHLLFNASYFGELTSKGNIWNENERSTDEKMILARDIR